MSYRLVLVLLAISSSFQRSLPECIWKDDQGFQYDLNPLDKSDAWQVKDTDSGMGMFSMVYVFNFCDFSQVKCHERQVGVYEALAVMGQMTENCDVVGSSETKTIQNLDPKDLNKGIRITFGLGDLCMDSQEEETNKPGGTMQPRQAIFDIFCPTNGKNDEDFNVIEGNECIDQFTIQHTVGCRGGTNSSLTFWVFKLSSIIFIIYMVGMYSWYRKSGLEGADAVPHLEFWQKLGQFLTIQLAFLLMKSKEFVGKFSKGGSGYNTV